MITRRTIADMRTDDIVRQWMETMGPPARPVTEVGSLPTEYVPRRHLPREHLAEIAALIESLNDRKARELAFALKTTPGRLRGWADQQIR